MRDMQNFMKENMNNKCDLIARINMFLPLTHNGILRLGIYSELALAHALDYINEVLFYKDPFTVIEKICYAIDKKQEYWIDFDLYKKKKAEAGIDEIDNQFIIPNKLKKLQRGLKLKENCVITIQ